MNKKILFPALALSILAIPACNLFGGLSKPSNDEQYLIAARACLDQGDYSCALSHYEALSNSKIDEKLSEKSLTTLAQNGIFSFSDLIGTLGSSRGGGASFSSLGNLLAQRGKTTSAIRQIIQETYAQNNGIQRAELRAFSKFISSLAMFNSILGTIAGADGLLTASDIVSSPTGCTVTTCFAQAAGACAAASGNVANFSSASPALLTNMNTLGDWTGTTDLTMLLSAAKTTQTHIGEFASGAGGGIFDAIDQILSLGAGTAAEVSACVRAQLIQTLSIQ